MAFAKASLAGLAAVLGVLFVPALVRFLGGPEKTTGLALIWAGFVEALLSPVFWIEVLCVFGLLLVASRFGNRPARIILFWTPAVVVTTLGCPIIGLFAFASLRLRR
ncbi:MAG: hypothetical protein WCF68_21330 [Terriglobales bacterium]